MSKLIKVTLEFDDKTMILDTAEECQKWLDNTNAVSVSAHIHGINPFDTNPVNWKEIKK